MARLTVVDGPNQGAVYELSDVCLLGRALDCQVHIQDLTVSRRHAKISRVPEGFQVEDLGSGNGTYVNEVAITRRILDNEDVVRVSTLKLQFEDVEASWQTAPDSVTMVGMIGETAPNIVKTVEAGRSMLDDAASITDVAEFQRMASHLKTIYAVSEAIGSILDMEELLPGILDRVFEIFPESERAFIMLREDGVEELVPKAIKRRNQKDSEEITISSTILNEVMTNKHALLSRVLLRLRGRRLRGVLHRRVRELELLGGHGRAQRRDLVQLAQQVPVVRRELRRRRGLFDIWRGRQRVRLW